MKFCMRPTYLQLATLGVSEEITEIVASCLQKLGYIIEEVLFSMLLEWIGCFIWDFGSNLLTLVLAQVVESPILFTTIPSCRTNLVTCAQRRGFKC